MTKQQSDRIKNIDDEINAMEAYIRDLKNERNKIILYDVCREILTDGSIVKILKGEDL